MASNNLSQPTFNKLYTVGLTVFFMLVYTYSLLTGRSVDWQLLLTFIVPTINHISHQVTQTQLLSKNIDADSAKAVATINVNGNGNGVSH